jgi:pilus assembly protein TadC
MDGLSMFVLLGLGMAVLLMREGSHRWQRVKEANGLAAGPPSGFAGGIDDVPLLLELTAASLDAGMPVVRALEVLASVSTVRLRRGLTVVVAGLTIGASWQSSWQPVLHEPDLARMHDALTFSSLTGTASAALLYAEAAQLRRSGQRAAEKRAAALGVKLVIPMGLCSLPAFICLGVAPVVLALVPSLR